MKPKEKASLSLIYVFISISVLTNYRCTVSEVLWMHKRAAKCAPRIWPVQLKIQSIPPPSSKDPGFMHIVERPKQRSAGCGELRRTPRSAERWSSLPAQGWRRCQMSPRRCLLVAGPSPVRTPNPGHSWMIQGSKSRAEYRGLASQAHVPCSPLSAADTRLALLVLTQWGHIVIWKKELVWVKYNPVHHAVALVYIFKPSSTQHSLTYGMGIRGTVAWGENK